MRKYRPLIWGLSFVLLSLALDEMLASIHRMLSESKKPTAPNLHYFHPRLLVFDGKNFEVYNRNHKDLPTTCLRILTHGVD